MGGPVGTHLQAHGNQNTQAVQPELEDSYYYSAQWNKGPLGTTCQSKHIRRTHVFIRLSTLGRTREDAGQGDNTKGRVGGWGHWEGRDVLCSLDQSTQRIDLTTFITHSHPWKPTDGLSHCQVLTHFRFKLSIRALGLPNTNNRRQQGEDRNSQLCPLPSLWGLFPCRKEGTHSIMGTFPLKVTGAWVQTRILKVISVHKKYVLFGVPVVAQQ